MDYESQFNARRDQRKYLRLKIITNRDLNFITAIRPDSTVTDLANRALNVYLELSGEQGTRKQLTIAAVKQGRYFMPKSQLVTNLLYPDEEVQVIIVKAKPKFPNQNIPKSHDYNVLTHHIKHFDQKLAKKTQAIQENPNQYAQKLPEGKSSSSQISSQSRSSQLQHSKRERKKLKRLEKKNKIKLNTDNKKEQNVKNIQKSYQKIQERQSIEKNIQKPMQFDSENVQNNRKQKSQQNNQESSSHSKVLPKQSQLQRQQPGIHRTRSDEVLQNPKKKLKIDGMISSNSSNADNKQTSIINTQIQVPRKVSVDNKSEKTPKALNPLQSPKVTFYVQKKTESPKILYIGECKNTNQLRNSIEKEKQRMKSVSPLLLPKSSPKLTYSPLTLGKEPNIASSLNGISGQRAKSKMNEQEKNKEITATIKNVGKNEVQEKLMQAEKQKKRVQNMQQNEKKVEKQNLPSMKNKEQVKKTQPQIIEEESSSQEQMQIQGALQHKGGKGVLNKSSPTGENQTTTKKPLHTQHNHRFHEIDMKIKRFKLQVSEDQEQ